MRGRLPATVALAFLGVLLAGAIAWSVLVPRNAQAGPVRAVGGFQRVAEPAVSRDKPASVFFMSALYCPFCAAERWALADALARFGSWSNLKPALSTGGVDGFSALPTYDFLHAHYTSRLVIFTAKDIADTDGRPLQTLTSQEKTAVDRYDPRGSIPFVIVDDAFVQLGSGYSPGLLVNKRFDEVRADSKRGTPVGEAIRHEADVLTALICLGDGGKPPNVCRAPAVEALGAQAR